MEEKNVQIEEGALKVTKLTLYEAVAIIVGANIGSGILGLAYSARKAGWPILLLWLLGLTISFAATESPRPRLDDFSKLQVQFRTLMTFGVTSPVLA